MKETVIERMERIGADRRIADFNVKMKMPYDFKKKYAAIRAREFVAECDKRDLNYHVSVGGLDSKVSAKCCYYLKERPCDIWAKEHNSVPFLGLMASEGGRRAKSLKLNGCNYFGESTIRSCPFAIFTRQDLLQLALDLNVPVPEIYGTIERNEDGALYTTGADRTGCSMCGFGIHLEKRPNRFDKLRERNPKEWEYLMYHLTQDNDGTWYGWGRVLDYIGVQWRDKTRYKP